MTGTVEMRVGLATKGLVSAASTARRTIRPGPAHPPAATERIIRRDLYSVGCLLFELVTGHSFVADTAEELPHKQSHEEPEMRLIPDGPEWNRLRGVIKRSAQKMAQDRYPDAGAMREDLTLALDELGDSADWTPPPAVSPAPKQFH